MEESSSRIPSPPPTYQAHLPSYDEISHLMSPMQTPTVSVTDQTTRTSQSGSTLAPPAYDDIMQHQLTGGQAYHTSVQQQQQQQQQQPFAAAVVNVQQNQACVESGEGLQQRIERRMAAIDAEIRQRQARRVPGPSRTANTRTDHQHRGIHNAQSAINYSMNNSTSQSSQPHHNTIQHPAITVPQSPAVNVHQNQASVETNESDVGPLQQRIARRMAAIDEEIRQRRAGTVQPNLPTAPVPSSQARVHQPLQTPVHQPSQAQPSQSSSQVPSHVNTGQQQHQLVAHTPSQRSSAAANQSEGSSAQGRNVEEEENLQLRLERRFASIDKSIRRRRALRKSNQTNDGCFCCPFILIMKS